tara:strand:- start:1076 stop:1846 length:771 start_codon:yes stop_codon:yes gene_type:complete
LKPNISIILNCYNGSKYLAECLDSIKKQNYRNFELIFWDNCSTDNSKKIFKTYKDKRFKYFKSKKNTILSKARNLASKKAKGDWLAFIDCDDIWYPNKLSEFKNFFHIKNMGVLFSDYYILKNKKLIKSKKKIKLNYFKNILKENYIFFSTVLIKKIYFFKVGMCDETLQHAEDYDILLKILKKYDGHFVNKKLIKYRIHDNNQSKHYKIESINESIYLLYKYKDNIEAIEGLVKLFLVVTYYFIKLKWKQLKKIL